jgi:protein SCO1/2
LTRAEAATWAVVAVVLAGVVAFAALSRKSAPPAPAPEAGGAAVESAGLAPEKKSELLDGPAGELGDLPCVERSGKAMRTSDLRGRFVVANFIFTSCAGTCPPMTTQMAALQKDVASMDDVRLVSFTVDPERDTPAVLTEYADRYGADKERWLFLRCETSVIQEIGHDRLKLVPQKDDLFMHSPLFALMDREGNVRAFYAALRDEKWRRKLLADLDTLRGEPSK